MGRGGEQHVARLLVGHVGEALHHQRQRAGDVGRRHRGAALRAVARHARGRGHGAQDAAAGRGDAPVLGEPAAVERRAVVDGQARGGDPARFEVGLEVGQGGPHGRVVHPGIAGGEDHDGAVLPGGLGDRVEPVEPALELGVSGRDPGEGVVVLGRRRAAPGRVDRPRAGRRQVAVGGLEVGVVLVGAVDRGIGGVGVGGEQAGAEGDAVHAGAVAARHDGAVDMGAVIVVDAADPGAGHREGAARRDQVAAHARGGLVAVAVREVGALHGERGHLAGEFRMGGEEAGIDRADHDAPPGDAAGIGLIGPHRGQAPVAEIFRRPPARRVAEAARILIAGRLRQRSVRDRRAEERDQAAGGHRLASRLCLNLHRIALI